MSYQRIIVRAYGGPERLELVTEPELPEPGAGDVRVKVEATSVAFTDTLIRRGRYPATRRMPLPFSPGYDIAGRVDKLGDGVECVAVGDRVAGLTVTGGYSEYICLPAEPLTRVPAGVTFINATAAVLSYVTAYQLLHRVAKVERGQTVLIHGAGGAVGSALLQLGQLHGLRVFATVSRSKKSLVEAHGAVAIDYARQDVRRVIRDNGQAGVDTVLDSTTPRNWNRGHALLNPGGRLVVYGMQLRHASRWEKLVMPFDIGTLMTRNAVSRSKSVAFYSIASRRETHPREFTADLETVLDGVANSTLQPVVADVLTLADVQDAHRRIEAGTVAGKLVMVMNRDLPA